MIEAGCLFGPAERASAAGEARRRRVRRELASATAVLLLLALVSCTRDPHELVITKNNRASVIRKVERSKNVSAEEKRLFASFIEHEDKKLRSSEGKTVAQVIDEERKLEEGLGKAAAMMEDAIQTLQKLFGSAAEQNEARKLTLKVLALRGDQGTGPFAGVDVDYVIENGFDKQLASFEGSLRMSDGQGQRIVEVPISESEALPAGESRNRTRHLSALFYPGLRDRLEAVGDVKCNWFPARFTFSDGTQLVATPRAGT